MLQWSRELIKTPISERFGFEPWLDDIINFKKLE